MLVAKRAFAYFRKMFIYLFKIFGCAGSLVFLGQLFSSCSNQGLLSSCNVQTFYCGGFSCCGAQASVFVARGLQSESSVFVAHALNCSMAPGIFLDQGWNSCSLHWQVDSLPPDHQGSPGNCL